MVTAAKAVTPWGRRATCYQQGKSHKAQGTESECRSPDGQERGPQVPAAQSLRFGNLIKDTQGNLQPSSVTQPLQPSPSTSPMFTQAQHLSCRSQQGPFLG